MPRERLGGAWPSAESSVSARPPLLETVETVEAPQPPGRMAARQRAKDAAFPRRSRGERAFPHGKGLERFSEFRTQPQVFTQSVGLCSCRVDCVCLLLCFFPRYRIDLPGRILQ